MRQRTPHEWGTRDANVSSGVDGVAGAISHNAVDHELETEHGDSRNRNDGHEALGAVHSVGEAECDGTDQGDEKRNQKGACESDSVAPHESPIGFGRDGSCVAIPVNSPEQENDDAEGGTEVLEDSEPGPRTKERKRNVVVEGGDLMAEPMSGVGKRVPENVRCDAHEDRDDNQGEAGRRVNRDGSRSELESCAGARGQACGKGFLGIAMKEPKHGQAKRQVKDKDARQCVAKGAVMFKRNEVLEIGGEGADDEGGHDETRAPKREGCSSMGERKRHYENYDCFGARGSPGLTWEKTPL
jgi:hypothetical protein